MSSYLSRCYRSNSHAGINFILIFFCSISFYFFTIFFLTFFLRLFSIFPFLYILIHCYYFFSHSFPWFIFPPSFFSPLFSLLFSSSSPLLTPFVFIYDYNLQFIIFYFLSFLFPFFLSFPPTSLLLDFLRN